MVIIILMPLILLLNEIYSFKQSFQHQLTKQTRLFTTTNNNNKKTHKRTSNNNNNIENLSTDPWKVLIRKLDTTKAPKSVVGKVIDKQTEVIDELKCPHFGTCSGCSINGGFLDTPIVRRSKSFFQSQDVNLKVHLSNITEWRTTVKLAVQPMSRWGGLKFGLYKTKSHIVEPIPECKVHHPLINIGTISNSVYMLSYNSVFVIHVITMDVYGYHN